VLAKARLGQEQYRVRGTPTLMLADGTKLRAPIAFPQMREHRIAGVMPLPCHGDECLQATCDLFERALTSAPARGEERPTSLAEPPRLQASARPCPSTPSLALAHQLPTAVASLPTAAGCTAYAAIPASPALAVKFGMGGARARDTAATSPARTRPVFAS
jgi:hypothetical protein